MQNITCTSNYTFVPAKGVPEPNQRHGVAKRWPALRRDPPSPLIASETPNIVTISQLGTGDSARLSSRTFRKFGESEPTLRPSTSGSAHRAADLALYLIGISSEAEGYWIDKNIAHIILRNIWEIFRTALSAKMLSRRAPTMLETTDGSSKHSF